MVLGLTVGLSSYTPTDGVIWITEGDRSVLTPTVDNLKASG